MLAIPITFSKSETEILRHSRFHAFCKSSCDWKPNISRSAKLRRRTPLIFIRSIPKIRTDGCFGLRAARGRYSIRPLRTVFARHAKKKPLNSALKSGISAGERGVELELLPDGTVLSATASGKEEGITTAFDWFWVNLPTPFRRGDILRFIGETSPRDDELLVVLENISTWSGKELAENGFVDCKRNTKRKRNELDFKARERLIEYHKKSGDMGDMNFEGYEMSPSEAVLWDTYATYLDFELCRDVPENRKALSALSAFMRGEISEDLLLNAYRYHVLKAALAETKDVFSLYTEEGLTLVGISPL